MTMTLSFRRLWIVFAVVVVLDDRSDVLLSKRLKNNHDRLYLNNDITLETKKTKKRTSRYECYSSKRISLNGTDDFCLTYRFRAADNVFVCVSFVFVFDEIQIL